uniref:Uncharacterized protein n=1 Tax=Podoviridae sp. ctLPy3 TaxID=2825244 RepID=A0A8S5UWB3_9CAUD|nr:MAG TPA: hypothetical protein [Podoviridae sp. ctLPy3]DAR70407.1 MAG TPA: hypothetical protein [Caudoviricetes sp.]
MQSVYLYSHINILTTVRLLLCLINQSVQLRMKR